MTDHYLTDERLMIQEVARDFTMKEILPVANELDPVQGKIPMALRNKLGQMGYFGIRMPEAHGGLGLGVFEYCLIAEELARGWMSVASIIARAASLMSVGGWPEAKRLELTAKAAQGEYLAAVSLSEPNVGSDLAAVSCKAVLDGDEWVITGNKYWCTFADEADYINLLARVETPGEDANYTGLRSFIIEKPRGELPAGCQGAPHSQNRLFWLEYLRACVRRVPYPKRKHRDERWRGVQEHRQHAERGSRPHRSPVHWAGARRIGRCHGI